MKKLFFSILVVLILQIGAKADEGMWLLLQLQSNLKAMQAKGLKLSAEDIYSVNKSSLKDAVVNFGGFCTGEIISPKGLILTNHHCGYDAIQGFSTPEHDYLTDGFWAENLEDEKHVEGLFVKFLVKVEDVTPEVLEGIEANFDESAREELVAKNISKLSAINSQEGAFQVEIKPFYFGNEYYMFIYKTYTDIRLVGAPPSSIGKYGGDTDNWMWPRHTGDFSMFRVYADANGNPAEYAEDNVPLKPKKYLPVSKGGVKESDFAMVMGYPGSTERFLRSDGVDLATEEINPAIVSIRQLKLDVLDKYMDASKEVAIKYASKRARISNYWKYFIGQTKGLKNLKVYEKKKAEEAAFEKWVNANENRKKEYGNVLDQVEKAYETIDKYKLFRSYLNEAIFGVDANIAAYRLNSIIKSERLLTEDKKAIAADKVPFIKPMIMETYEDFFRPVDKELFWQLSKKFANTIPANQLPPIIKEYQKKYGDDWSQLGNKVYDKSIFTSKERMEAFFDNPKVKTIQKDPLVEYSIGILEYYSKVIKPEFDKGNQILEVAMRGFVKGLREMNPEKIYYPNANFTMRLTYGTVGSYEPRDAVFYDYITTLEGVIEKEDPTNPEFIVADKLKELYKAKDYGHYGNNDSLVVCFITNNDITGGNSGSPVINGEGKLIGCAFDGNWEAMSGDIAFEPKLQRTICVDSRYILFVIDKFAGATRLIEEINPVD